MCFLKIIYGLKTQKAKEVAKSFVLSLRKTCAEVKKKKGAATSG